MTYFVGISGPIASGKSTLAEEIKRRLGVWDVETQIVSFASGVKYLASLEHKEDRYSLAADYFLSLGYSNVSHYVVELLKAFALFPSIEGQKNRRLLQFIGTDLGRNKIHPDIWIRALEQKVDTLPILPDVVLIDDLRFVNESYFVHLHVTIDTVSSARNRQIYARHISQFPKEYIYNDHVSEQEYTHLRFPEFRLDIEPPPVQVGNVVLEILQHLTK